MVGVGWAWEQGRGRAAPAAAAAAALLALAVVYPALMKSLSLQAEAAERQQRKAEEVHLGSQWAAEAPVGH